MFKSFFRNTVLAASAITSLAVAAPAEARDHHRNTEIYIDGGRSFRDEEYNIRPRRVLLQEYQIEDILRAYGYRHIQEMELRGERYRVIAVRHNGAVVKLRVSAFTGEIITSTRIGWIEPRRDDFRHHEPRSGVSIEFGWGNRY